MGRPRGSGDAPDFDRLRGEEGNRRIAELLMDTEAMQAQMFPSNITEDMQGVARVARNLVDRINQYRPAMEQQIERAKRIMNPSYNIPFSGLVDYGGLGPIQFMQKISGNLFSFINGSYRGLFNIADIFDVIVRPRMDDDSRLRTLGDVKRYVEAVMETVSRAEHQLTGPITVFEKYVGAIFTEVKKQHALLKHKYQGIGNEVSIQDNDIFEQILNEVRKRNEPQRNGPLAETYNDNCFLTELLLNTAEQLPRRYEKTVPTKGGKHKVLKQVDEMEIERAADILVGISHDPYIGFLKDPNRFLVAVAEMVTECYDYYASLEGLLRDVVDSIRDVNRITAYIPDGLHDKHIANPAPAIRRMLRYNFLSIRPKAEETAPRNKVEKDYVQARRRMMHHLDTALERLSLMPDENEGKSAFAVKAVREAVVLKADMDEIMQSELDRALRANIQEENEFYRGRTGQVGAFYAERQPAPQIRYRDVRGASFDRAKEHIEEVVGIAAFPRLLRASSPRGKLKSNILLIGPYGCGKSELARAVASDRRVIGLYTSVSDVLTAYMHESVKNVKRVWEEAMQLRKNSRNTKPVALIQDEFDAWFSQGNSRLEGDNKDMQQIRTTMQEVMDGVVDYEGVFMIALTNRPGEVPDPILRRFKYVDVVGQLTDAERLSLFKHFLYRGLPISSGIRQADYQRWMGKLQDAPGDVLGKIADEVHFKFIMEYRRERPGAVQKIERQLLRMQQGEGLSSAESAYVKQALGSYRRINAADIDAAVGYMLMQPAVLKEISAARKVYAEAADIMRGLTLIDDGRSIGFGARVGKKSEIWTPT